MGVNCGRPIAATLNHFWVNSGPTLSESFPKHGFLRSKNHVEGPAIPTICIFCFGTRRWFSSSGGLRKECRLRQDSENTGRNIRVGKYNLHNPVNGEWLQNPVTNLPTHSSAFMPKFNCHKLNVVFGTTIPLTPIYEFRSNCHPKQLGWHVADLHTMSLICELICSSFRPNLSPLICIVLAGSYGVQIFCDSLNTDKLASGVSKTLAYKTASIPPQESAIPPVIMPLRWASAKFRVLGEWYVMGTIRVAAELAQKPLFLTNFIDALTGLHWNY